MPCSLIVADSETALPDRHVSLPERLRSYLDGAQFTVGPPVAARRLASDSCARWNSKSMQICSFQLRGDLVLVGIRSPGRSRERAISCRICSAISSQAGR